ncbi:MAG: hypothetical protein F4Z28_08030 [Gammaproteobacteria bacterium]|nr:hypothetical protein [Gammaproteobacteria bacterium]
MREAQPRLAEHQRFYNHVRPIVPLNAAVLVVSVLLSGCLEEGIRQSDLDSWKGVLEQALDTHPAFLFMRLERSMIEVEE